MAGRVLSAKNESRLREALAALSEVLAQLGDEEEGERHLRGLTATFEQRTVALGDVETREIDGSPLIAGYAAVFNRISQPLWGFQEQIAQGAFAASAAADVRALWQHDVARVLGRTTNGTLRLWEDDRGLAFEMTPPDTQDGRDAIALISRGDVDRMSFGFTVPNGGDTWDDDTGGYPLRTLKKVNLIEISPVTFPAYLDTSASVVRNAPEWVQRALALGVDHSRTEQDDKPPVRAHLERLRRRINLYVLENQP